MKFAVLKYEYKDLHGNRFPWSNLGDEIQSLAAEQFLPHIDTYLDRDTLAHVKIDKHFLIMNSWFSHFPEYCFPPSDSIIPIFVGFHITSHNNTKDIFLSPKGIEYFKRHEPIGCRDKFTAELLAAKGIKSFYSKCLTLTFPKRKAEPKEGKVFIVDAVMKVPIPESLREKAIIVSQAEVVHSLYDNKTKIAQAKSLLEAYRNEASLVITTRLHCALPCIAMGIPVVFFGDPNNYRLSILHDLNVDINRIRSWGFFDLCVILRKLYLERIFPKLFALLFYRNVNWNPAVCSIEKEKKELIETVRDMLKNKIAEFNKSQIGQNTSTDD